MTPFITPRLIYGHGVYSSSNPQKEQYKLYDVCNIKNWVRVQASFKTYGMTSIKGKHNEN